MVWLILNDCNTQAAQRLPLDDRSPFLEYKRHFITFDQFNYKIFYLIGDRFTYMESERFKMKHAKGSVSLESIDKITTPRVIKSHLSFHLLHPRLLDISKVL